MVMVPFSYFKGKIQQGLKCQTVRRDIPYWRELTPGTFLHLWWKPRSKTKREFLGKACCTEILRVEFDEFDWLLACLDGFETLEQMQTAFVGMYREVTPIQRYVVIRWEPLWCVGIWQEPNNPQQTLEAYLA